MGRNKKQKHGSGGHTVCADQIRTMRGLEEYLCSLAKPAGEMADPEQCRECRLCAFGRKYVTLNDQQKQEEQKMAATRKPVDEATAQERLEKALKQIEEINQINVELAGRVQQMEKKQEDSDRRLAENHVEIQSLRLTAIQLKARLWDMEHPEEG